MALLKIARMGHPVLVHRAEEVADPTAREVRRLVADMVETMEDADGVGLVHRGEAEAEGREGAGRALPALEGPEQARDGGPADRRRSG